MYTNSWNYFRNNIISLIRYFQFISFSLKYSIKTESQMECVNLHIVDEQEIGEFEPEIIS